VTDVIAIRDAFVLVGGGTCVPDVFVLHFHRALAGWSRLQLAGAGDSQAGIVA
jgi:hypothetical protein